MVYYPIEYTKYYVAHGIIQILAEGINQILAQGIFEIGNYKYTSTEYQLNTVSGYLRNSSIGNHPNTSSASLAQGINQVLSQSIRQIL